MDKKRSETRIFNMSKTLIVRLKSFSHLSCPSPNKEVNNLLCEKQSHEVSCGQNILRSAKNVNQAFSATKRHWLCYYGALPSWKPPFRYKCKVVSQLARRFSRVPYTFRFEWKKHRKENTLSPFGKISTVFNLVSFELSQLEPQAWDTFIHTTLGFADHSTQECCIKAELMSHKWISNFIRGKWAKG